MGQRSRSVSLYFHHESIAPTGFQLPELNAAHMCLLRHKETNDRQQGYVTAPSSWDSLDYLILCGGRRIC